MDTPHSLVILALVLQCCVLINHFASDRHVLCFDHVYYDFAFAESLKILSWFLPDNWFKFTTFHEQLFTERHKKV